MEHWCHVMGDIHWVVPWCKRRPSRLARGRDSSTENCTEITGSAVRVRQGHLVSAVFPQNTVGQFLPMDYAGWH